jgi:dihydroorotate dehydrogenase
MGAIYENLLRPLLFRLDAEKAHDLGTTALDYLGRLSPVCRVMEATNLIRGNRPIRVFGIDFPNAVGLAAGMDKNARFWRAAPALGFGHVEIGTITGQQQPGNPRPRVFRFPEEKAIINRMGFNNEGAEAIAARLKRSLNKRPSRIPLGINIGKSRIVPLESAIDDYLSSFHRLVEFADYITINVSSPNTHDLRRLQHKDHLHSLLQALTETNRSRARKLGEETTPLLLKIAPDLNFEEIDDVLAAVDEWGIDGIIATNTTIARPGAFAGVGETGGLSGRPLHPHSIEIVNYISRATSGRLPIIGSGGIDDPATAGAMMDAGASLVQVYTGMVYRGPFVARDLARALSPRHSHWI